MPEPRIARTWDSLPPVVYDGDEAISTRVLEYKYRQMTNVAETLMRLVDLLPAEVKDSILTQGIRSRMEKTLKELA